MKAKKRLAGVGRQWLALTVVLLAAAMVSGRGVPASAADYGTEAGQLVEKARFSFENMMADTNMTAFHDVIKHAKGVFVAPQVLEGAFIFGASGGSGVFLAWDGATRRWNGPAFYRIGGASFGLQIGGQASEVVLLAMTDRGINSLLATSVKLGADASIAAGPVGAGAAASSANLSVDILSFSRAKGLYAGVSLDGAVVAIRHALNEGFYGKKVDAPDILIKGNARNPLADRLVEAVGKASGRR